MPVVDYPVKGKDFKVKRYVIDNKAEPTAVVFGKFSPFSGPKGHGKLIDFAKDKFKEVIIVSPTRNKKDKNVDIFTDEQKAKIIEKANPDIKFHRIQSDIPIRMFTRVLELGYERPVFIVGEDRGKSFSRFFKEYNKNNKAIKDQDGKDFGKGEYLVVPRSAGDTSATKVRKALQSDDKEEFIRLTGYDNNMWDYMKGLLDGDELDEDILKAFVKSNNGNSIDENKGFCYFYYEG